MTSVVLASTSAARAAILAAAGVPFQVMAPDVDEAATKAGLLRRAASAATIAEQLAEMKATHVSRRAPGLVIGADQTLEIDGRLIDKAATLGEARRRLMVLRGREHHLYTAVAVASSGSVLWRQTCRATLRMRPFSDDFLDLYLARQGDGILSSVGCYQLENQGAQLFAAVEGDYFAILGLPLYGLLDFLRQRGVLAT